MNRSLKAAAAAAMGQGFVFATTAGIIAAGPFLLIPTASADPLSDRCNGQTPSCTHPSDRGQLMYWEYDRAQDSGYRTIASGFKASPGDPNGDQSFFSRIDGKVSGTSDQWIPLAHWGCSQLKEGTSYAIVLDTAIKQNPQSSEGDIATVLRAGMAAYCPGVSQ
jgi:hypothetical protein